MDAHSLGARYVRDVDLSGTLAYWRGYGSKQGGLSHSMDTPFTMVIFETGVARKLLSRCRRQAELKHNAASMTRRTLDAHYRTLKVADRDKQFDETTCLLRWSIVDQESAAKMYGAAAANLETALKE